MARKPVKEELSIKQLLKDPEKLGIDINKLNNDLDVDKFNLDQSWTEHDRLFTDWGLEAMYAKAEWQEAWETVKTVRSHIILETKGTAQEKEARYRTHPEYLQAKQNMIFKEAKWFFLEKVVLQEFHFRKAELQDLLKMYHSEYYSEPKADKEGSEKLKEARVERANKRVKTKSRRK